MSRKDEEKILRDLGVLEEDTIPGILNIITESGVKGLTAAEVLSEDMSVVLYIEDSQGKGYYLGISAIGTVDMLREDNEEGTVLYTAFDY